MESSKATEAHIRIIARSLIFLISISKVRLFSFNFTNDKFSLAVFCEISAFIYLKSVVFFLYSKLSYACKSHTHDLHTKIKTIHTYIHTYRITQSRHCNIKESERPTSNDIKANE